MGTDDGFMPRRIDPMDQAIAELGASANRRRSQREADDQPASDRAFTQSASTQPAVSPCALILEGLLIEETAKAEAEIAKKTP